MYQAKVEPVPVPRIWERLQSGVITCTQRNKWALNWVKTHPETSEGLVEIGSHKSDETARRFLRRSLQTKKIKLLGALLGETGRGKNVYGNYRPRSLEHDYELTKWCRMYPHLNFERGNNLERRADGIAWGDAKGYLELDTGSMPLPRVQQRWESYRNSDGYVIVITTTEKRMIDLMEVSRSIASVALFCLLDEVREDHEAAPYISIRRG